MNVLTRPIVSRMSLDEFLVWDAPGPWRWQLIDGEAAEMAPASELHGLLQAELAALLRNHLLDRASPCRVVIAPGVVPRARSDMNFRIPDLGVTCSPPSSSAIVEDPVILAEVLSPSNEAETRSNLWAYTTIPTVQEILLLRSSRIEAELLRRQPDGSWPANPDILTGNTTFYLDSIAFSAILSALYRTTGLR